MARRESARAKERLREVKDAMTPICRFSRYTWPLIDAHSPLLRRTRRSARRLSALGNSSYGLPHTTSSAASLEAPSAPRPGHPPASFETLVLQQMRSSDP